VKQVEVTILGQGYLLTCPEDGQALLEAAVAEVDREMAAIRNAGKIKARERMAVLAALNLAYRHLESGSAQASAASPARGRTVPTQTQPLLDELVQRIDSALGHDGQLL
jgi:cell division protein ZapA